MKEQLRVLSFVCFFSLFFFRVGSSEFFFQTCFSRNLAAHELASPLQLSLAAEGRWYSLGFMAHSNVSNTHRVLVPTVYMSADRHLGATETRKTFTRLSWRASGTDAQMHTHRGKRQTETGGVVRVKPTAVQKQQF